VREQLKEFTKQYDKSENDLKALQSVGQVSVILYFVWILSIFDPGMSALSSLTYEELLATKE
jgi:hypothetical protein